MTVQPDFYARYNCIIFAYSVFSSGDLSTVKHLLFRKISWIDHKRTWTTSLATRPRRAGLCPTASTASSGTSARSRRRHHRRRRRPPRPPKPRPQPPQPRSNVTVSEATCLPVRLSVCLSDCRLILSPFPRYFYHIYIHR